MDSYLRDEISGGGLVSGLNAPMGHDGPMGNDEPMERRARLEHGQLGQWSCGQLGQHEQLKRCGQLGHDGPMEHDGSMEQHAQLEHDGQLEQWSCGQVVPSAQCAWKNKNQKCTIRLVAARLYSMVCLTLTTMNG